MKFSVSAIAAFVSAVTAATLPPAFTLVADGGYTVLTDGQFLYYGGNVTTKEVAIFHSADNGAVTFTSRNAFPTGWQSLYIIENTTLPVGLTVPHSGFVPEGASAQGFGSDEEEYFTHDGDAYFAVDGYGSNPQKTVYWYGHHNSEYRAVNLWVKELKEPSSLD